MQDYRRPPGLEMVIVACSISGFADVTCEVSAKRTNGAEVHGENVHQWLG
jgi:hypothetical protein